MTTEPATDSRWQESLRDLGAPSEVIAWARDSADFQQAWQRCGDPLVRIWLARAGGVSQREVVGAIHQLLEQIVRGSTLPADQQTLLERSLAELHLDPPASSALDSAADRLATGRRDWTGPSHDLGFAIESLLRSAKDVHTLEAPHDFSWLVDAAAALEIVTSGFKTKGFLAPADADRFLASSWHPSGHPPEIVKPADRDGLTDKEIVGRAQQRAIAGTHASQADIAVALTVELENHVLSGGFGQYFFNYGIATQAATAYRRFGRHDLAATVDSARALALTIDPLHLLGHPKFQAVNSTFWAQLKTDPTPARAALVRRSVTVTDERR